MAHGTSTPTSPLADRVRARLAPPPHAPLTPGKVATWLFLATEVMFFTGLIGSYIVLRAGSTPGSYSNLYPPGTDLARLRDKKGVVLLDPGADREAFGRAAVAAGVAADDAARAAAGAHHAPQVLRAGLTDAEASALAGRLGVGGATTAVEGLRTYSWPPPYHGRVNPLSIDLTAANTFILICSSVTMVLALAAIRKGQRWRLSLYLLATLAIGGTFLGVQVVEYLKLMRWDPQPLGVGRDGHFRPASSLFGSCFFTMTGFHGAHVFGGLVALAILLVQSLRGAYTAAHHAAVELVGLYWHFVDLVWILLFTVVYLI